MFLIDTVFPPNDFLALLSNTREWLCSKWYVIKLSYDLNQTVKKWTQIPSSNNLLVHQGGWTMRFDQIIQ